jgi:hypothetical protein
MEPEPLQASWKRNESLLPNHSRDCAFFLFVTNGVSVGRSPPYRVRCITGILGISESKRGWIHVIIRNCLLCNIYRILQLGLGSDSGTVRIDGDIRNAYYTFI